LKTKTDWFHEMQVTQLFMSENVAPFKISQIVNQSKCRCTRENIWWLFHGV